MVKCICRISAALILVFALTACGGKEKEAAEARESVKEQVASISRDLPVRFKGGYTFQSVGVDEKNNQVRYLYKIDAEKVDYIHFLNEKTTLESQLRQSLSSQDEGVRKFVDQIRKAGMGIVYRYEFTDGNVLEIVI